MRLNRWVTDYGDWQFGVYLDGLSGKRPALPMSYAELERQAEGAMSAEMWSYVAGGAGDEPAGLLRRIEHAGGQRDEAFGYDLAWRHMFLLYSAGRGNLDNRMHEIGQDEADRIEARIRRSRNACSHAGGIHKALSSRLWPSGSPVAHGIRLGSRQWRG